MSVNKETVNRRTELSKDGYAKIEAKIQTIENLASNGIYAEESRTSRFYQITLETKKLRQILREVLLIVHVASDQNGEGDAA